jgi:hypothetical protein
VQLTNDSAGLDIDDLDSEVVAGSGEEVVLALKEERGDGGGEGEGRDELHHLEVEELREEEQSQLASGSTSLEAERT